MRQPQVTRTITTTKTEVMCVNIKENKTENITVTVPRTYKDDKALLKAVEKAITNADLKPVHILNTETVETLYGMSEQKFIENAEVLPARTAANDSGEKPATKSSK